MRKPARIALAATKPSPPKIGFADAPTLWVCLALMLALVVLACRIASIL
jgi:hypothetical protein